MEDLERRIFRIRDLRVMLDEDLARLCGVTTKQLNQAVRRNLRRFPMGFMIRLTAGEAGSMRSQNVTASRRNVRHPPSAFTERGAIMLAAVLSTPIAIDASIRVAQAFVRMREMIAGHELLRRKIAELELASMDTMPRWRSCSRPSGI